MYHAWLFDFLDGLGGGNDPLNFQNRAIAGFWENARFISSNDRKTTFEWPKLVSKASFPRFWVTKISSVVFLTVKWHNAHALSHFGQMLRFVAFGWNIAIYALCQAQNVCSKIAKTILYPCMAHHVFACKLVLTCIFCPHSTASACSLHPKMV